GKRNHISFDVEIAYNLTIREAHEIASALEEEIRKEFDGALEINIHIDPLQPVEKKVLPLTPDEEREIQAMVARIAADIPRAQGVHKVTAVRTEKGRLLLSFHCAFDDDALIDEVHTATNHLEHALYRTIPDVYRVVVHAEPLSARD
ncbi:MAG: cation transporter, partial [Nitrospirales bacterium]|nr:cation transporter [Nitrospirales bacterium]